MKAWKLTAFSVIINRSSVFASPAIKPKFSLFMARLIDGNKVIRMKCCNDNSNEGMDMKIGNEDCFVWCT